VLELDVDAACNIAVRRVNKYAVASPVAAATSPPRYCTR
jgi:hypothetical protein